MSEQLGIVYKSSMDDAGAALREQLGVATKFDPSEFGAAIRSISGGADGKYLIYSNENDVLFDAKTGLTGEVIQQMSYFVNNTEFSVALSAANTDVTCYCIPLYTRGSGELIIMGLLYAASAGNGPSFYSPISGQYIECTIYEGNERINGIDLNSPHVLALSLNQTTKRARFFYDGEFFTEKIFTNSAGRVDFGCSAVGTFDGKELDYIYAGVVAACESDSTIISNMQNLMDKFNIGQ